MNCKEVRNYSAIDIQFQPLTLDTCRTITKSDHECLYPILDTWENLPGQAKRIMGINVGKITAGYALTGIFREEQYTYGEVVMIHIRPELRGFGLGNQLGSTEYIHCMEQNPDFLKIRVADRTGKVNHFAQQHGFQQNTLHTSPTDYPTYFLPNSSFPQAMESIAEISTNSALSLLCPSTYDDLIEVLRCLK